MNFPFVDDFSSFHYLNRLIERNTQVYRLIIFIQINASFKCFFLNFSAHSNLKTFR